jgi:hypothetical protein
MNVEYGDKAAESAEGEYLLRSATERLAEVLGPESEGVRAYWDREEDGQGRAVFSLKLRDINTGAEVKGIFTRQELESLHQARFRMYRLWSDLLRRRYPRSLQGTTGGEG